MLCQVRHVLFDELDALIKGRLVVKEGAGRLFVYEAVLLRNTGQLLVARKEALQALHLLRVQQAADDEDDATPCFTRILHIVYLLAHANRIKHIVPYSQSIKIL